MERIVYDRMQALEERHWWFQGRRRVIGGVLEGLALRPDARILEVGCGSGGNLGLLKGFGTVEAMEPDPDSRDHVARHRGLTPVEGRLPGPLPFEAGSFDMICAFDVLEHVDEDQASVTALAALLKPGGVMLATVPAYSWMWSAHDESHHHKRRYRRDDFRTLFDRSGLAVEKATYFNTILFPVAVAVRGLKRLLGLKGEDDRLPSPVINRALTGAFGLEAGLVQRGALPFGLSILVVARRPK